MAVRAISAQAEARRDRAGEKRVIDAMGKPFGLHSYGIWTYIPTTPRFLPVRNQSRHRAIAQHVGFSAN